MHFYGYRIINTRLCHELTSIKIPFNWTEDHQKAFDAVKDMLSKDILNNDFDPEKETELFWDANKFAVCGILIQQGKVIACTSRCLNKYQKNWATIEREFFGLCYSLKKFRVYLRGHFFIGKTDHKPLVGLIRKIDSIENQRLLAMALATTEYSFNIEYVPGKKNIIADYGTRHIPETDWPVNEEDPLELSSLFPSFNTFISISFPVIEKHLYSTEDFDELNKLNLNIIEVNSQIKVRIGKQERVLVPRI